MKNFTKNIISISLLLTCTLANAQFGQLLNQLQNELNKKINNPGQAAKQEGPAATQPQPAGGTGLERIGANGQPSYCDVLKGNKNLNVIVDNVKKFNIEHAADKKAFAFNETDVKKDYLDWAEAAIEAQLKIRLGTMYSNSNRIPELNASIKSCLTNEQSDYSQALRGWNGTPDPAIGDPQVITRYSKRHVFLVSLMLDGSSDKLAPYVESINADLIEAKKQIEEGKIRTAKAEKDKAEREQAEQQAAAKREEESKKYAAYMKTSEGKLVAAYQLFQVVSLCKEVSLVGFGEYDKHRSRMKEMETIFKKDIAGKSTDQLWEIAEKNNRGWKANEFMPPIDLIETIKENRRTNFVAASKDCSWFQQQFAEFANEHLGTVKMKKNF